MARKTMKSAPYATAGIELGDDFVSIVAGKKSIIQVSEDGIHLVGPRHEMLLPEDRRVSGLWNEMPIWTQMLPSTIVSPLPSAIPLPPIKGIQKVVKAVTTMMGMLTKV